MKITLTTYEIANELMQDESADWSYAGAKALAKYLESVEDDTGEEMELDTVAIRCEFSEHASLQDWADDYFGDSDAVADQFGFSDEDELQDAVRDYIYDHGTLIEFDDGIIVSSF